MEQHIEPMDVAGATEELLSGLLAFLSGLRTEADLPKAALCVTRINAALDQLFQVYPEVILFYRGTDVVVNQRCISTSSESGAVAKQLTEVLRGRQIGRIHFRLPPLELEWQMVAVAYIATAGRGFNALLQRLVDCGVTTMHLDKLGNTALFRRRAISSEQRIRQLVFGGIEVARSVFHSAKRGGLLPLKAVKRVVQSLIDVVLDGSDREREFLLALTRVKNWNGYESNHATNVAIMSLIFGRELEFPREILFEISLAAFLHGLGKCFIPDSIQQKPGRLDTGEWRSVSLSAMQSFPIIARVQALDDPTIKVFNTIWDLSQQRLGQSQAFQRGLYAQVIHLCSAYDALTTVRPFRRRPMTHEEALVTIAEDFEERTDPALFKLFGLFMADCYVGHLVRLRTGEFAVMLPSIEREGERRVQIKLLTDSTGVPQSELIEIPFAERRSRIKLSVNPVDYPQLIAGQLDALLEL